MMERPCGVTEEAAVAHCGETERERSLRNALCPGVGELNLFF